MAATRDDVIVALDRWERSREAYAQEAQRYVSLWRAGEGQRPDPEPLDRQAQDRLNELHAAVGTAQDEYRREVEEWDRTGRSSI